MLEALASALEAGLTAAEALAVIARAGPISARLARTIEESLPRGSVAGALHATHLLGRDGKAVIAVGEEVARLAPALRWAVDRERIARQRRRAIVAAIIGPLTFAALTMLTGPLPAVVMGTGSFARAIGEVLLLVAAAAGALFGLPRLFEHPTLGARIRAVGMGLPLVGALFRQEAEDRAAAVIAAFADPADLALAARIARLVVPPPYAQALASAAADPFASVIAFSESFGLALAVGGRAGDLPARIGAFHQSAARALTQRLRGVARTLAFAVVLVVVAQSVTKLLSTSIPGLGGDLGSSSEMRDLEKELNSIER
ncbi:MAG TPA: type II secretion system F family protein [Polyangia bacterium]